MSAATACWHCGATATADNPIEWDRSVFDHACRRCREYFTVPATAPSDRPDDTASTPARCSTASEGA